MAEFNREDFREKVRDILREYKASYREIGEQVVDKVLEKMNSGKNISKAVKEALSETAFFDVNKQAVADAVYLSACAGYGVLPSIAANADIIKEKLLSDSWAPDKMNLSQRLHSSNKVIQQMIIDTIRASMINGHSVKEMAMKLYDGYNSGQGVVKHAELAAYLSRMEALARLAANRDPKIIKQYQNAVNSFRKQINGLETSNLKAAYRQFIQAAERLDTQFMEKAVHVAVEEKTRYYAERIARTESVRAWFDGFIAENQDNDEVWGYRWVLSSRHNRVPFDQCDVCANMNVGWGKGVYPKNRVPSIPRHPHCMCMLEVVFTWEVIGKDNKLNEAGARDYIDSLDDKHKMQLFGIDGMKQYKAGADWQTLLRGWNGFEQPKSRLSKADFDLQLFADSDINVLLNYENAVIPEAKIYKYILNKEHSVGGYKAIVFDAALGYNQSNGDKLIENILSNLFANEAIPKGNNGHGETYEVNMILEGPNGNRANVVTGWIIDSGKSIPRLTSAYVKEKKVKSNGNKRA